MNISEGELADKSIEEGAYPPMGVGNQGFRYLYTSIQFGSTCVSFCAVIQDSLSWSPLELEERGEVLRDPERYQVCNFTLRPFEIPITYL